MVIINSKLFLFTDKKRKETKEFPLVTRDSREKKKRTLSAKSPGSDIDVNFNVWTKWNIIRNWNPYWTTIFIFIPYDTSKSFFNGFTLILKCQGQHNMVYIFFSVDFLGALCFFWGLISLWKGLLVQVTDSIVSHIRCVLCKNGKKHTLRWTHKSEVYLICFWLDIHVEVRVKQFIYQTMKS